ncbi:MAG: fumarylacetoacetate hydrolase family protein [Acidimicrobiales bacterium]
MTRLANLAGRAVLVADEGGLDIERRSEGRFAADIQALYDRWDEFLHWADRLEAPGEDGYLQLTESELLSPAPSPHQVFGIGLNYRDHVAETGMQLPSRVATFTKFPTCIVGGFHEVELPEGSVDYEVELVVVMGRRAYRVADWEAWSYVAGVTVGQDLSERILQREAGNQFCLGKSFPGFGPMGPWLVTPDELTEPDDMALRCSLNGEVMQDGRTSDMVFSVPRLIEELSAVVPLLPGDVIFTGTPAGVGWVRQPPRFLQPGDVLESTIEGIGTIRNRMLEAS